MDTSVFQVVLNRLPFNHPKEQQQFRKELQELIRHPVWGVFVVPKTIRDLYRIYVRELSRQSPFLVAFMNQSNNCLIHYFEQLFETAAHMPASPVERITLVGLCRKNIQPELLQSAIRTKRLNTLKTDQLQALNASTSIVSKVILQYLVETRLSQKQAEFHLGISILLEPIPKLVLKQLMPTDLEDFLLHILPAFHRRFAEDLLSEQIHREVGKLKDWLLAWLHHQKKWIEQIPNDDPYYQTDFKTIVQYVPKYIWWNKGMEYQNATKVYPFGSAGFRHLAIGGSVRKGPDERPYTRRMAREFVNLPFDFNSEGKDLYIYFFTRSLGASGHLLDQLQGFIRHYDDSSLLKAELDRWHPIIQKLVAEGAETLRPETLRHLLGYLYHCIRDKPRFSVQQMRMASLLANSRAYYERIERRRQHRAISARLKEEARFRKVNYWPPHPSIQPMEFRLTTDAFFVIAELTSEDQLDAEGVRMHHCVGQYADRCREGISSIWSLREYRGKKWYSRVTIEVQRKCIVQMAGPCNGLPDQKFRALIRSWIEKNGIDWNN